MESKHQTKHQVGALEPNPAPNWNVTDVITQLKEETHIEINNTTTNIRPTINYCAFTPTSLNEEADTEQIETIPTENLQATNIKIDKEPFQLEPLAPRIPLEDNASHKYKTKLTTRIMRKAISKELPAIMDYRMHLDGGANLSVTPNSALLINYRNIKRHAISGVAEGAPALYATGLGYLPWRAQNAQRYLLNVI